MLDNYEYSKNAIIFKKKKKKSGSYLNISFRKFRNIIFIIFY